MVFPTRRLNAKELPEQVVARGKVYELRDGQGLTLRVRKDGGASWQFVYNHRCRRWRYTVGPYPLMSLTQARQRHLTLLYQLRVDGINPAEEKRRLRERPTVGQLATEYLEQARALQRDYATVKSIVTKHIMPALDWRIAEEVRLADLVAIARKITHKGTPQAANRFVVYVREVYRHGIETGAIEHNPAKDLRKPNPTPRRDRVLTEDELRDAWNIEAHPERRALIRLLIATGCRESEIRTAQWSDIDGDWLVIPPARSKTHQEYRVYLNRHAQAELEQLSSRGQAAHLFPGRDLSKPIGPQYGRRPLYATRVTWKLHDLRRTMRTGLARIGVHRHIAERALNHAVSGIEATYNKYDYSKELSNALDAWSDEIDRILAS